MLRLIIVSESDSKIARKFEKNVIFVWEMIVTCVHTAVFFADRSVGATPPSRKIE